MQKLAECEENTQQALLVCGKNTGEWNAAALQVASVLGALAVMSRQEVKLRCQAKPSMISSRASGSSWCKLSVHLHVKVYVNPACTEGFSR